MAEQRESNRRAVLSRRTGQTRHHLAQLVDGIRFIDKLAHAGRRRLGAATGRHRHGYGVIKANAFEYAFIEIELK